MKIIKKILGITLLSIIGILLIGLCVIVINSPGRLDPLKDKDGKIIPNALSEKSFIEIGGLLQGFFLRAENPLNPVILYLHGGPGSPELAIFYPYETSERLEKYFTVCYWEQRGAGISFNNSIDISIMTLDQIIEDARQITEYLKTRFNQEKIYLAGHSWGSYFGIKIIEKHPENYIAFIGLGQAVNQVESERLLFDYMMRYAIEINDKSAVKDLEKFDINASDFPTAEYIGTVRSSLMNKYGIGLNMNKKPMGWEAKNILLFKGYSFLEKIKYAQGMSFSLMHLCDYVDYDNLFISSTSFQIPVYILQGKHDYITSYTLAQEYVEVIDAPDKAFFTFENSAHNPNAEEPEKFVQIIRDIVLRLQK